MSKAKNAIINLSVLFIALCLIFTACQFLFPANPQQKAISACTKELSEAGRGSGIANSRYEQTCVLQCQRKQLSGCN